MTSPPLRREPSPKETRTVYNGKPMRYTSEHLAAALGPAFSHHDGPISLTVKAAYKDGHQVESITSPNDAFRLTVVDQLATIGWVDMFSDRSSIEVHFRRKGLSIVTYQRDSTSIAQDCQEAIRHAIDKVDSPPVRLRLPELLQVAILTLIIALMITMPTLIKNFTNPGSTGYFAALFTLDILLIMVAYNTIQYVGGRHFQWLFYKHERIPRITSAHVIAFGTIAAAVAATYTAVSS